MDNAEFVRLSLKSMNTIDRLTQFVKDKDAFILKQKKQI